LLGIVTEEFDNPALIRCIGVECIYKSVKALSLDKGGGYILQTIRGIFYKI